MIQLAIFEGLLGFHFGGRRRPLQNGRFLSAAWLPLFSGRERVHIFDEDSQTGAFNSAALFFNLRFFVEAAKLNARAVETPGQGGKYLV
jgi:hypothetical protein